jgi:hypothetical protein
MKTLLLLIPFTFPFFAFSQQVINMNETDVEMKVQTWHYSRYEKSKEVSWKLIVEEGDGIYEASFIYQGDSYTAAYNTDGFILWEKAFISEKNIPQKVIDLLDYRIVKYKIEYFTKYAEFDETRKVSDIQYSVLAVTKTGGQVELWFDENFELVPEKKPSEVARR